jgi:hypothetical protein
MIPTITQAWRFDAAQTNYVLKSVGAAERATVWAVAVTCDNGNTVNVAVRVGFGATALATVTTNGAGGIGICVSHPGVARGGGQAWNNGGQPLGVGATGEDILITCGVPTGGFLDVVMSYWIDDMTDPA